MACAAISALVFGLISCGGGGGADGGTGVTTPPVAAGCAALPLTPSNVNGPAWWGFGRDSQHSAQGAVATQALNRTLWRTPVDVAPQYSGTTLFAHYGSPVITARNTVITGVKTGATDGFRVEARSGSDGTLRWTLNTDYVLPAHNWVPSYNVLLTPQNRLYIPAAGGKLIYRDDVDTANQTTVCAGGTAVQFYGATTTAVQAVYDANVFINTPLTADAQGNVFFGFIVTGPTPANLSSGIARIGADGRGSWVAASMAASDTTIAKVAMNSAPAISRDGSTVYVAVNGSGAGGAWPAGYLLALDSTTLATKSKALLVDPVTGSPAWISDDGTSSPLVGPDGDVYFGVLESNAPAHNFRGWLLHFDANLRQSKVPGSFGWDNTPSIVPSTMVPTYRGSASYLLLAKYNNYGGVGSGDGKNRIAILDPSDTQADPVTSSATVMREVMTILGPTPDPDHAGGVKEWCINTAAVDPLTRSVLVNSEDGFLYRWDLASNSFTQKIKLDNGLAQSYTPTAIGPDGVVYAINNATLFAVGN